jgi:uncharacterized protein (TIGR00730 family)
MKIGIFCSANDSIDPEFFRLTEELGTWMGRSGHDLVFGGCNLGLMECIARSVHDAGGHTIGMIPTMLEKHGRVSDYVDVNVACSDLSDRKQLMMAQADIFIALPGGVGTLDEIFTVAASHTIGYHSKRVVLYNMKGFWDSTIALLDDMQQRGVIRGKWSDFIAVANDFESLINYIE